MLSPASASTVAKRQKFLQVQNSSAAVSAVKQAKTQNDSGRQAKRSAQSNERRLETLDIDQFMITGKNQPQSQQQFSQSPQTRIQQQLQQDQQAFNNTAAALSLSLPLNVVQSSETGSLSSNKRNLFSNVKNCSPKSGGGGGGSGGVQQQQVYSGLLPAASATSQSQRQSKVSKLNFFDSRRLTNANATASSSSAGGNCGVTQEIVKKARAITNENLSDQSNNCRVVVLQKRPSNNGSGNGNGNGGLDQEESGVELPTSQQQHLEISGSKTNNNISFRKQPKVNLPSNAVQRLTNFPPVFEAHSDVQSLTSACAQQQQQQQPTANSQLSAFITKVAKGEILSFTTSSKPLVSYSLPNYQTINTNNTSHSPGSQPFEPTSTKPQGIGKHEQQHQQLTQQQLSPAYSSTVPSSSIVNMQRLFNTTKEKKNVAFPSSSWLKKPDVSSSKQVGVGVVVGMQAASETNQNNSHQHKSVINKLGQQKKSTPNTMKQVVSRKGKGSAISGKRELLQTSLLDSSKNHSESRNMDIEENRVVSCSPQRDQTRQMEIEEPLLPSSVKNQLQLQPVRSMKPSPSMPLNLILPVVYYNTSMASAMKGKQFVGYSDNYFEQLFKEHFIQSFHSLHFCKSLKPISQHVLNSKKVMLPIHPHNQGKKTVVFDLDETLIHCNESAGIASDVIIPIRFPNNEVVDAGINVRPYARECLEELSKHFEVIVFTASHGCYAVKVLEELDPENKYISHRLFRESCVQTEEGVHIKDLRIFANRNIKDLVLIDNAAYSFAMQLANGIPILPYYHNKADQELKLLSEYLMSNILNSSDVRDVNKQHFKMHLYSSVDKIEAAAKRVYHI